MSVNDRLRVRIYAGAGDRAYGTNNYGEQTYGGTAYNFGDLTFGDYDFGRYVAELAPGGKPFNCYIVSMTLETGRPRALDQNKIGICNMQLVQMDVPTEWIAEDGASVPEAVVLGRTVVVESYNAGVWSPVFTGTVESATAEYIGTGEFDQPNMKWAIVALDSLNRANRITEAPGVAWREEEKANVRLEALATRAALGVRYISSTTPVADLHPIEDLSEANLLVHLQNTAKYGYRLAASQDGSNIDVEDLNIGAFFSNITGTVYISSPHQLWPNAKVRLFLPCPQEVTNTWPMDKLMNQVTVTSPDVPTDPTPDDYIWQDAQSIQDFGRRTYGDEMPTVEAAGVSQPAKYLGQKILNAYSKPKPWITQMKIDFTDVIDVDTPEPTLNYYTLYGNYTVGFAFALRMFRGSRVVALSLPKTDTGRYVTATGYVLGIAWDIKPDTVNAIVYLEAVPDRYGSASVPDIPPEPAHPTNNQAIGFGNLSQGWTTYPRMTFTVPATVDPVDVEVDMDWYDSGSGNAIYLRSPTTLNVPRLEFYLNTTTNRQAIRGTNAAGTNSFNVERTPIANDNRKRFYFSIGPLDATNKSLAFEFLEPGALPSGVTFSRATTAVQDWVKPGNPVSIGWEGPTGNNAATGFLFGLQIRKKSTGQVLVDIRPQDWAAGSWTDPYGNVITITPSVLYSNDIPQSIVGS